MNQTESKTTRLKFHEESSDNRIVLEYTLKCSQLISSSDFRQQENLVENQKPDWIQAAIQQNNINQRNIFFRFVYIYSAAAAAVATAEFK